LTARFEGIGRIERFVLDVKPVEADRRAQPARVDERREAFAERDRRFAVVDRKHFAIAPHAGVAAFEAVARPPARLVEIVAGQQGSPARAEEVPLARIARRRSAGN
jgi:hypothetical protein